MGDTPGSNTFYLFTAGSCHCCGLRARGARGCAQAPKVHVSQGTLLQPVPLLQAQGPASSFSVLKFPIPHLVKVMQVQAPRCSRALTLPGILTVALPIQKVSD